MVESKKYEPKYYEDLMTFHLNELDGKYTALPNIILGLTIENPNKVAVVILKNSITVGFFVLHQGCEIDDYIASEKTVLIRALSIHDIYHRQGIATLAMKLVDVFTKNHFPDKNRLALAVNMKNAKAIQLYFKVGFKEDHRRMGIKGEQMVLVKKIETA